MGKRSAQTVPTNIIHIPGKTHHSTLKIRQKYTKDWSRYIKALYWLLILGSIFGTRWRTFLTSWQFEVKPDKIKKVSVDKFKSKIASVKLAWLSRSDQKVFSFLVENTTHSSNSNQNFWMKTKTLLVAIFSRSQAGIKHRTRKAWNPKTWSPRQGWHCWIKINCRVVRTSEQFFIALAGPKVQR